MTMTLNTTRDANWTDQIGPDDILFGRGKTLTASRFKCTSKASRQRSAVQKAPLPPVT